MHRSVNEMTCVECHRPRVCFGNAALFLSRSSAMSIGNRRHINKPQVVNNSVTIITESYRSDIWMSDWFLFRSRTEAMRHVSDPAGRRTGAACSIIDAFSRNYKSLFYEFTTSP